MIVVRCAAAWSHAPCGRCVSCQVEDCHAEANAIAPSEHGSVVCPAELALVVHRRLASSNSSARSKNISIRQVLRDEKRQMAPGRNQKVFARQSVVRQLVIQLAFHPFVSANTHEGSLP